MSSAIQQLMEQIDSRVMRERLLIFITLLAIIFLLWNFLLQGNFDDKRKALELEAQSVNAEQSTLEVHISELSVSLANDPAIVKSQEIIQLSQRIKEVEANVAGLSQGLIRASQLPQALEEVLQKTSAITVLQVRTLPAHELQLTAKSETPLSIALPAQDEGGTGVYKHSVLIRVSGSYAQLLKLMVEIESLQWKFYWESLDYRVTQYPNAMIDIRVFTLSSEEGLLGV